MKYIKCNPYMKPAVLAVTPSCPRVRCSRFGYPCGTLVGEADGQERGDSLNATTSERRHCGCSLTGWLYVGRFHQAPGDQVASAEDDTDIPLTRMLLHALGIAASVTERTDEDKHDPSTSAS